MTMNKFEQSLFNALNRLEIALGQKQGSSRDMTQMEQELYCALNQLEFIFTHRDNISDVSIKEALILSNETLLKYYEDFRNTRRAVFKKEELHLA